MFCANVDNHYGYNDEYNMHSAMTNDRHLSIRFKEVAQELKSCINNDIILREIAGILEYIYGNCAFFCKFYQDIHYLLYFYMAHRQYHVPF